MNIKKQYCGRIAILGKVNVGKSTILNQIVEKNISIVSRKKNTTQNSIIGIKTEDCYQFIYIDTPGFFLNQSNYTIEYKNIFKSIVDSTILIMFIIDRIYWTQEDEFIFNRIQKYHIPIIVIINKIDKILNKTTLLPFISFLKNKFNCREIVPISAKKIKHINLLKKIIKSYLPVQSHMYPRNRITTNSKFFTISEIIRKQLILHLGDELPSIIKVEIESFQEKKQKQIYIKAIIKVANIKQKSIVIGKKGVKIKKISIISRNKIKKELNKEIHLFLWVQINFKKK